VDAADEAGASDDRGCSASLRSSDEEGSMVVEASVRHADLEAVLDPVEREKAAIAGGRPAEYLAILTEDARFMPPKALAKAGSELRAWLAAFVQDFRVEWLTFRTTEVVAVEDLAYHAFTYTWRITPRAGGESNVSSGKGLHILRRQADGSWKIAREIWNDVPG
jgi:ketosteroid isomerase-like protein